MLQHDLWPVFPWWPSLCQWTEVEYWRHPQYVSDTGPRAISSYRDTSSRLSKPNLSPLKASEMQPYTAPMGICVSNHSPQEWIPGISRRCTFSPFLLSARFTVNTRHKVSGPFQGEAWETGLIFPRVGDSTRGSYIKLSYWTNETLILRRDRLKAAKGTC